MACTRDWAIKRWTNLSSAPCYPSSQTTKFRSEEKLAGGQETARRDRRRLVVGRLEGQAIGRRRPADVVPLGDVAAEFTQQVERFHVLDALGHDPKTHFVAEIDRRANEL